MTTYNGKYIAGYNMPGYMPESEPEEFDTFDDAVAYIEETVARWQDEDDTAQPYSGLTITGEYASGKYGDYALWVDVIEA